MAREPSSSVRSGRATAGAKPTPVTEFCDPSMSSGIAAGKVFICEMRRLLPCGRRRATVAPVTQTIAVKVNKQVLESGRRYRPQPSS